MTCDYALVGVSAAQASSPLLCRRHLVSTQRLRGYALRDRAKTTAIAGVKDPAEADVSYCGASALNHGRVYAVVTAP